MFSFAKTHSMQERGIIVLNRKLIIGAFAPLAITVALASNASAASWTTRITNSPSAHPGQYVTANVTTHPSASCSITVNYYSGPSQAKGLYSKRASTSGRVSWTWMVGTRTYAGNWPVRVSCSWGGVTQTATRYLHVY
jgi:micrococcal nuclease